MAIVKNNFRVSRLEGDILPPGRGSDSSQDDDDDDDELQSQSLETESDDTDASEVDSGMGSDDYDLSELGEADSEYCQVGNQTFLVPLELYEVPDLGSILSLDTWNNCLTEEERFALAEYLPDMDKETFDQTLKELFSGRNFHFGNPVAELFGQLKGGLCEPRVYMYRRCLSFFQRRQHYHQLQKYQNCMVDSLVRMRDAWENYTGYGIEERLRLLNILKSQRHLGLAKTGDWGSATDSENDEYAGGYWKKRSKMDQWPMRPLKTPLDAVSHKSGMILDVNKHGKEHPKGILKVAGTKASKSEYSGTAGRPHLPGHSLEIKHRSSGSSLPLSRQYTAGVDAGAARSVRKHKREIDDHMEEQVNEMTVPRGNRDAHANRLVNLAPYNQHSFDSMEEKGAYTEWNSPVKDYLQKLMPKEARIDKLSGKESCHHDQAEALNTDFDLSIKSKKRKSEQGSKSKAYRTPSSSELYTHCNHKAKTSLVRETAKSFQNGTGAEYMGSSALLDKSEDTESDSSEQVEEEEDVNLVNKKLRYSSGLSEYNQLEAVKPTPESKKVKKHPRKNKREIHPSFDQETASHVPDGGAVSSKGMHKSKAGFQSYPGESFPASAKLSDERKHGHKVTKKSKSKGNHRDVLEPTLSKELSAEPKRKMAHSIRQESYIQDSENGYLDEQEFDGSLKTVASQAHSNKSVHIGKITEKFAADVDFHEKPNPTLMECNLVARMRRGEAEDSSLVEPEEPVFAESSPEKHGDDFIPIKKKTKKRSVSSAISSSLMTADPVLLEKEPVDAEPEPLPTKKPFTLITPTVHSGFSFSIIHLLSAIRKAMITSNPEDVMEIDDGRQRPAGEDRRVHVSHSREILEGGSLDEQKNLPSLTVQEIVNRVRINPGDPCILETQEPLQDLVRGVLKIFSSKTAPLGAKGWKALVFYEKSTKSWSWIGPVPSSLSDHDAAEEETSSEAWGIPHKMLVKLVDAFANWLKSGQETLKQIGSLPAPPVMMLPNMDEKERFKDLRAQKSLVTICPSSDEVRAYFRREEFLRYSVPDRAFSYTAIDGRKSTVAPLRRGGGKPTSKARDHFMLKPDRPPHVTILCLVRDAAARLPGSIGTRADVCTLIRDSQYLVEDVSDAQINSVVSGALDRLHYEQDPCVQFDGERKLWVYLHREREEEDFEDDGTSSTKKWKRPRRDSLEHGEQMNDLSCPVIGDQDASGATGYEFSSDPNIDPSSVHRGEKPALFYNDLRSNMDSIEPLIDSIGSSANQGHPMGWEVLGVKTLQENRMLCQENSTNEDFDDEAFGKERPMGLII